MALRGLVLVLLLCCLDQAIASYCSYSGDCYGYYETCCSDGVCRTSCTCSYDFQCESGEQCCRYNSRCKEKCSCLSDYQCSEGKRCCNGYCKTSCIGAGIVVGPIIGTTLFVAVTAAIAAYFCCKCCPGYRHRHSGRVIAVAQVPAQPMQTTTTTTQRITQVQSPTAVLF